jgi:hypothetical protein
MEILVTEVPESVIHSLMQIKGLLTQSNISKNYFIVTKYQLDCGGADASSMRREYLFSFSHGQNFLEGLELQLYSGFFDCMLGTKRVVFALHDL